jgi:hypothetical protein
VTVIKAALFAATALAVAGPSAAQDGQPKSMTFVVGQCTTLSGPGLDLGPDCQDVLVVSDYTNHRFNIAFVLTDQRGIIGFSGDSRRRETANGAAVSQPLDSVLLVRGGASVTTTDLQGAGTCTWTDFGDAGSEVTCDFLAEGGRFQGTFIPDGTPPDIQTF